MPSQEMYWEALPPEEAGDALAAAGVLTASRASELSALGDLIGSETNLLAALGSPLTEWVMPSRGVLSEWSVSSLAEQWRLALDRCISIEGKPATVRLWVHSSRPAWAVRMLERATPPAGGAVVVSVSKVLGRTRPVSRWTWPLVVGVDSTAPRTAELLVQRPRWLADLVEFVDLSDSLQRCSLAVLPDNWDGTLIDGFGRTRAAAAVVLGPDPGSAMNDVMMNDHGYGAVAATLFTGDDDPGHVVELVRHLSHDMTLDEAAAMAARTRDVPGQRLYGERAFLERTRLRRMVSDRLSERAPSRATYIEGLWAQTAKDFVEGQLHPQFLREDGQATYVASSFKAAEAATERLEQRFLKATAETPARQASTPKVRHLRLDVSIGPSRRPGRDDRVPIDETYLDWDGDHVELRVVLVPLVGRAGPKQQTLTLPRTGESAPITFAVRASPSTPYRGRLVVLREHRFVQTAIVEVTFEGVVGLNVEAVVRPLSTDLLDVVPAAVAIVHNHDASGRPLVTTIAGEDAWSVVPGDYRESMSWFREGLEAAAEDPDAFGDPLSERFEEVVVGLAEDGAELYRLLFGGEVSAIASKAEAAQLVAADRVSVLSVVPGDVLPIEFVYDRPLSTDNGRPGRLCPNAAEAARRGTCCTGEDAATTDDQIVCPFGFWGMRKVIERHVNREQAARVRSQGGTQALAPSPTLMNSSAVLRLVLGGASTRVDLNPTREWATAKQRLTERLGDNVRFAESWRSWKDCLDSQSADLLLLLPHVGRMRRRPFLEIGQNDALRLVHDLRNYVRGPQGLATGRRPIVLLLGCGTSGDDALNEFPSKFLDQGARLVIATLGVVRGRFVAPLAANLTLQILEESKTGGVQVGELLRRSRLEAFVRGDPTAMTLIAFGDSSWLLKSRN